MSELNVDDIMKILPHRYPFLLVDRVLDYVPYESLNAVKNVSIGEPFFVGHFPVKPVMPGVLIIEALAQAAGILAFKSTNWDRTDALFYLGGVDKARFKKVVEPGDQLSLSIKVNRYKLTTWKFFAEAHVGEEVVCSAEITCLAREYK